MQPFLYRLLRRVLATGLLALALALPAAGASQPILVLGDSISAAYGMSLDKGWVALMERQLRAAGHDSLVINASISGETTGGGLRRLSPLLEEHKPGLVIIELGGNDGLRGFPVNKLRDNLDQLVGDAAATGARVLLLGMEIPPNYGSRYTDAFRKSFELAAQQHDATLIPFPLVGIATEPGLMQADGIHPTVEAQPLLLDNILPSVLVILESM